MSVDAGVRGDCGNPCASMTTPAMDLAKKKISDKKRAHNAKRRLAQREAKKMKTACKRTGLDGEQAQKNVSKPKKAHPQSQLSSSAQRISLLREECFAQQIQLPRVRREVYFVRSKEDMVQGHVVDKVPLPTRDEDIDKKCLRSYKVFDSKCVETGVRGDPPWNVEEDFPADTITEVFMVHKQQKLQTAAFAVALSVSKAFPQSASLGIFQDLGGQDSLRDLLSAMWGMSPSPMITIRGGSLSSFGIDPREALGVANMTPEVLTCDMGEKRHHTGVGFVGDPGVRYRYTEGQADLESLAKTGELKPGDKLKGGVAMIAKGCSREKYWTYMRRLQPICNAICKSAVWMFPELKQHADNIKDVWDHQGLACFAYMVCSIGLNFGAGFHLDKDDDGHALWGVAGEVEIAFPESNTVFRVRDGATLSFDARQYYHACVAMAEDRQENCVFSLWNSAEQRARLRREQETVAKARREFNRRRAEAAIPDEDSDEFGLSRRDLMFYYDLIG